MLVRRTRPRVELSWVSVFSTLTLFFSLSLSSSNAVVYFSFNFAPLISQRKKFIVAFQLGKHLSSKKNSEFQQMAFKKIETIDEKGISPKFNVEVATKLNYQKLTKKILFDEYCWISYPIFWQELLRKEMVSNFKQIHCPKIRINITIG